MTEGDRLLGKPFGITAEELTQCAYYDLKVTAHHTKSPLDVAEQIINNRINKVEYNHQYPELQNLMVLTHQQVMFIGMQGIFKIIWFLQTY